MDVNAFIKASGAECVCGQAIVMDESLKRTVVAKHEGDGYVFTEEGEKLAAAFATVAKAKKTRKKTEA